MRTEQEIDEAQTKLLAFLKLTADGIVKPPLPKDVEAIMRAQVDILCWILGHNHRTLFGATMERFDRMFKLMKLDIPAMSKDMGEQHHHTGEGGQA